MSVIWEPSPLSSPFVKGEEDLDLEIPFLHFCKQKNIDGPTWL